MKIEDYRYNRSIFYEITNLENSKIYGICYKNGVANKEMIPNQGRWHFYQPINELQAIADKMNLKTNEKNKK